MIPGAPKVDSASRNAQGWLPERAARYCDPATLASAWGWYIYAPIDFSVALDKTRLIWTYGKHKEWFRFGPNGGAQFPHFAAEWDVQAPEDLLGKSPPFLTALPEPGLLQIWTGYFVRLAEDWSLAIRAPLICYDLAQSYGRPDQAAASHAGSSPTPI